MAQTLNNSVSSAEQYNAEEQYNAAFNSAAAAAASMIAMEQKRASHSPSSSKLVMSLLVMIASFPAKKLAAVALKRQLAAPAPVR